MNATGNLFPLFTRNTNKDDDMGEADFVWHQPLGSQGTCLQATYYKPFARAVEKRAATNSKSKVKIACFDLDGCLINPRNGKVRAP